MAHKPTSMFRDLIGGLAFIGTLYGAIYVFANSSEAADKKQNEDVPTPTISSALTFRQPGVTAPVKTLQECHKWAEGLIRWETVPAGQTRSRVYTCEYNTNPYARKNGATATYIAASYRVDKQCPQQTSYAMSNQNDCIIRSNMPVSRRSPSTLTND